MKKLKIQLESENEQMYRLLNEVEVNMQKIAEEAVTAKEQQWKNAMNEIVDNSRIEIHNLQEQLLLQKRNLAELKVGVLRMIIQRRNETTSKRVI